MLLVRFCRFCRFHSRFTGWLAQMSLVDGVLYSAPAPDGYTPDFNRPYDATALIACIGVFLPLAVITSAIRIYTRSRIVSELAIDDCKLRSNMMAD